MKKIIFFISFILLSCNSDDGANVDYEIVDLNTVTGPKLIRIEKTFDNSPRKDVEIFTYNTDNKLTEVDEEDGFLKKIEYENGRVEWIKTYDINDRTLLVSRDSFAYNANGQLDKIYRYQRVSAENIQLYQIIRFEYDSYGRLIQTENSLNEFVQSTLTYEWLNNRMTRVNYFDGGKLRHSRELLFDFKNNPMLHVPIFWYDPINLVENNIRFFRWIDFSGIIDASCYDCTYEYTYNADDYPTRVKTQWGQTTRFFYE